VTVTITVNSIVRNISHLVNHEFWDTTSGKLFQNCYFVIANDYSIVIVIIVVIVVIVILT
jgi:hypothetical protein